MSVPCEGSGTPSDACGHVKCPGCGVDTLVQDGRYIDHTRRSTFADVLGGSPPRRVVELHGRLQHEADHDAMRARVARKDNPDG